MTYLDSISTATRFACDQDLPTELWGTTIANEAAQLAGLDSDHLGTPAWD